MENKRLERRYSHGSADEKMKALEKLKADPPKISTTPTPILVNSLSFTLDDHQNGEDQPSTNPKALLTQTSTTTSGFSKAHHLGLHPIPNLPPIPKSSKAQAQPLSPREPKPQSECIPHMTKVYIYLEDIFFPYAECHNPQISATDKLCRFDASFTKEAYQSLTEEFNVEFVICPPILLGNTTPTTTTSKQEKFDKDPASPKSDKDGKFERSTSLGGLVSKYANLSNTFSELLQLDHKIVIREKPIKEAIEEGKKSKSKIVMSDELLAKQKTQDQADLLTLGSCILFMSIFTNNEFFPHIDFAKIETGRGACTIESKLRYSHIKNRIKVGLFFENSCMKPKLLQLLKDSDKIEFIPVCFNEVPLSPVDVLISRSVAYRVLGYELNDLKAKKQFDNYQKYEEKYKKTLYLDRFENCRVAISRSEFLEELKEQCEVENGATGQKVYEIPWTREGTYLDSLDLSKKNMSDPILCKMAAGIPFPLLTKSDLSCVHKSAHSFLMIKERPHQWEEVKGRLKEEYSGKKFIVQAYLQDDSNTVYKTMSVFDHFAIDTRFGIESQVQNQLASELVHFVHPEKTDVHPPLNIAPETVDLMKRYHLNLAKRLKLNLMSLDFLYDKKKNKIMPIDLNKMTRLEYFPNFREVFDKHILQHFANMSK